MKAVPGAGTALALSIDAVRAVGADRVADDRPTAQWLTDWRTLVDARARYADDLAAGQTPGWNVPVVKGQPITERLLHPEPDEAQGSRALPLTHLRKANPRGHGTTPFGDDVRVRDARVPRRSYPYRGVVHRLVAERGA